MHPDVVRKCTAEYCPDRSTQKLKPYKSELPRLLRTEQHVFSLSVGLFAELFLFLLCLCHLLIAAFSVQQIYM